MTSTDGTARRSLLRRRALKLIGVGFALLAVYLLVQSTGVLVSGFRPHHSALGIVWTAVTAVVMFALAAGKARTGAALADSVLTTEGRGTLTDAVLLGLMLDSLAGLRWADPAAGPCAVAQPVGVARGKKTRAGSSSPASDRTMNTTWWT
ncbi:hypothetical protein [Streptomyces sp. IMTB 2501]|uniref:hypothetical protein n=1 Tax=Streptomyces sp. IMTB 2501 TaxID=1776340 RepID=UPI002115DFE6|nr:hypothetical protein [Streptomyces sp. IMTB 2501]